ncbi:MAG: hypothetical protein HN742_14865 [Lentisphaerae bacterium]|jgi:HEAT repeat protein|nr:hypothetical protein [Lentisphaerota bacterium]MBT4821998.1 hypothetical protein [Lentisphaerota bacterium]MBT5609544.1 hypothetical protein [Lentisphaerota bacterium]MBT7058450.1 hypothetical protein [Lentisphaerota bacterium]MBT7843159.1 hypothetical protein [Lentisphaerota bacterium]
MTSAKLRFGRAACLFLFALFSMGRCYGQDDPQQLLADGRAITGEQVAALCRGLVPPAGRGGEKPGDDTAVREALHGVALRAGQSGEDVLRAAALKAFSGALQADVPDSVKVYLLDQLRFFADPSIVPILGPLLARPELCDLAARVLVTVGTPEAAAALRQGLLTATGVDQRITLVQALGDLGDSQAASAVRPFLAAPERKLKMAAITALGRCGGVRDARALEAVMKSESAYERARALDAQMTLLRRRHAAGDATTVADCVALMEAYPEEPHVQCAGLTFLAAAGGQHSREAIVACFPVENPRVRATAFRLAATAGDGAMTARVAEALPGAPPKLAIGLLGVLARRGDRSALPEVRPLLTADAPGVRTGAAEALAALAGRDGVPELVPLLGTADKADRQALERILVAIPGPDVNSRLGTMLSATKSDQACSLLSVLGRRGAHDQLPLIIQAATDPSEPVRAAALRAAGQLARPPELGQLVRVVVQTEGSTARRAGEDALISCLRRIGVSDQTVASPLGEFETASPTGRISLLRVLGTTGHPAALAAIRADIQHAEQSVRDGAVRALADWPDQGALEPLYTVIQTGKSETHKVLALRGYVRLLAKATGIPTDQRLAKYRAVMPLAGRDSERKLVVAGIGTVKTRQALDALLPYLGQPALRSEAAAAVISVAEKVRGAASSVAVRRVLDDDVKTGKKLQDRARKLLGELEKHLGCVTRWALSGPHTKSGVSGHSLGDVAFGPELPEATDVSWREVTTAADGRINLIKVVGGANRVVYLRCEAVVPEATKVAMDIGSDDGVVVWLNGEVVHKNNVPRAFKWGEDRVETSLQKGSNILMLKIMQGGGGWEANARIRNLDGSVITELELK